MCSKLSFFTKIVFSVLFVGQIAVAEEQDEYSARFKQPTYISNNYGLIFVKLKQQPIGSNVLMVMSGHVFEAHLPTIRFVNSLDLNLVKKLDLRPITTPESLLVGFDAASLERQTIPTILDGKLDLGPLQDVGSKFCFPSKMSDCSYESVAIRFDFIDYSLKYFSLYADADLVIVELNMTYKELLLKHNIKPFIISDQLPSTNDNLKFYSQMELKWNNCPYLETLNITYPNPSIYNSQEYSWTQYVVQNCHSIPGDSSSPVFDEQSELVGLVSGTISFGPNEYGYEPKPVAKMSVQPLPLHGCLDKNFKFDLNLHSCKLPKSK